MASRQLAALSQHDARHRGGSLVDTLRIYLECCGNLESTARRLSVHSNTLRARVARIEELLGRDLNHASTRLDLQLAFATLAVARR
jgi:purine catabolism regulator